MTKQEMLNIPKLGFGFMRLPLVNGELDQAQAEKMVDEYLANGFTYFDTAYPYHNGQSEIYLKKTLIDRHPRENYTVADKLPSWSINEQADVQKIFDDQLQKTGAGYFDFYLLHAVNAESYKKYTEFDCWNFGKQMKEKGLVKHFGFSFHDKPEALEMMLSEHPDVDFVQLQINYVDWESTNVCSKACYDIARKYDIPVVIMEPVKGGTIASMRTELEEKMKAVNPDKSIASWAMRYCASLEGLVTILSGMSTEEQLKDNIDTMVNFKPFSDEEKACLDNVIKELENVPTIQCTACDYCTKGCPVNIKIPELFKVYNGVLTYGESEGRTNQYNNNTKDNNKASDCIACGQCEGACPQHLPIISLLEKVAETVEK